MIRPRHPWCHLPIHPVISGDGVLHAVGEGVPQVKLACHIWWRNNHHEHALWWNILYTRPAVLGLEKATLLPPAVPSCLHILRTVGIRKRTGCVLLCSWRSRLCILSSYKRFLLYFLFLFISFSSTIFRSSLALSSCLLSCKLLKLSCFFASFLGLFLQLLCCLNRGFLAHISCR